MLVESGTDYIFSNGKLAFLRMGCVSFRIQGLSFAGQ